MLGILQRDRPEAEDVEIRPAPVMKVIEVVGTSHLGFTDAVRNAVRTASRTLRDINGVDVKGWTAQVKDGRIVEYRANVKIAFVIDETDD